MSPVVIRLEVSFQKCSSDLLCFIRLEISLVLTNVNIIFPVFTRLEISFDKC